MLKLLRKGATSVYVKIFLGIIVIVFVFWGIGSFTSQRKDLVAKVNGVPITFKEYQEYYNFQISRIKQTFGELSEEELAKFQIKEKVLEDLIKFKLLEKEAEDLGIKITPIEINYIISQIPSFQENGRFNFNKYQYILRELKISPEFFEKIIKLDLIIQRLNLILTTPILVSKQEIEDYLGYMNHTMEIIEAQLPLKVCVDQIRFTENDLENYYLAHRDLYKEEEKIKLNYFLLPYKESFQIPEEEIRRYYEQNLDRFREPFKVKLRTIFIAGNNREALKRAEAIKSQIASLEDFSKFGKFQSNWFEEEAFPENIKDLIKKARKGDIIGPLKTSSGFMIIGIEEIKPERFLKFEEVRSQIYKFLKKEKVISKTKEKADQIYKEIIKVNGLSNWAKINNISLKETPWLLKTELAQNFNFNNNLGLITKIFDSPKGEFFGPIETSKGLIFIEIKDKLPQKILQFKECIEKVKKDYLNEKGKEMCEKKIQTLLKQTSFSFSPEFIIKEYKIKRYQLKEKFPPLVFQELLNRGHPGIVEKPLLNKDIFSVFYINKILPSEGDFSEEKIQSFYLEFLKEKRETYFNQWYQNLRKKARLEVYSIWKEI